MYSRLFILKLKKRKSKAKQNKTEQNNVEDTNKIFLHVSTIQRNRKIVGNFAKWENLRGITEISYFLPGGHNWMNGRREIKKIYQDSLF